MTRSKRSARKAPREADVVGKPPRAARTLGDDDLVDMRTATDDRCGRRFDEIGNASVREVLPHRGDGRRREDDVANQAKADEQDLQGSTVASSMSMTGMSSLIGYTRWHC